ncbi:MAG TPA: hypothetical protein DHW81_00085, partial [Nitrospiraceae bacterium]|nr:hypothetical protein [Nitrospiraceae bacterium]
MGPRANIGDICRIESSGGHRAHDAQHATRNAFVEAEVIGFKEDKILLMPLGDMMGIGPGSRITARGRKRYIRVGPGLLGRVLDGLGNPMDGRGHITGQL